MMSKVILALTLVVVAVSAGLPKAADHVILLSIDGLHQQDLSRWISLNPSSNIAMLAKKGVQFTNAYINKVTDSFPGVLALTTGATSATTGVWYDNSYDRTFFAPGTPCNKTTGKPQGTPGSAVLLDESVDIDMSQLTGGGKTASPSSIDVNLLPLDSQCKPVYPHQMLYVNTIFEVVKAYGLTTAWCDKHPAYDLLNGPSGKGVDDLYTPEIASIASPGSPVPGAIWSVWPNTPGYDTLHANAIVNEIHGLDSSGKVYKGVPALMGGNFQSVSVAQKVYPGGYSDAAGTPSAAVQAAMAHLDSIVGRIVTALAETGLTSKTAIILTAKHGQSAIDPSKLNLFSEDTLLSAAKVPIGNAADDDGAYIWLQNSADTAVAAANLMASSVIAPLIDTIYYGASLTAAGFGNPAMDPRVPDIIIKTKPGVIFVGNPAKKGKGMEHGGLNMDDQHVGLLVVVPNMKKSAKKMYSSFVHTQQVAPTVLSLLGLDYRLLQGARIEGTKPLPL